MNISGRIARTVHFGEGEVISSVTSGKMLVSVSLLERLLEQVEAFQSLPQNVQARALTRPETTEVF